jgi:septum formation protein
LTKKDIDQYLETGEPFDKAGAYGIQDYAALFVDRLEGCYFNVVGFPVVAFRYLLLELGYDITDYIEVNKK